MSGFLQQIDTSVFFFFNHTLSNGVFDAFFSAITNIRNWIPVYIIFALLLIIKGGKKGRIGLVMVLLLVTLTDQVGFKLLKEHVCRPRPFDALHDVLLPNGKAGGYSFPSNHALNNFGVATFFSMLYRQYRYPLFITASLIALSRVYLGVHYPSDILGGAALGVGFGWCFGYFYKEVIEKKFISNENNSL
jgi:undecaprenyl-diphosphatase